MAHQWRQLEVQLSQSLSLPVKVLPAAAISAGGEPATDSEPGPGLSNMSLVSPAE